MNAISLFTGCGGLDLGLESAGITTRVALEMDRDAIQSLKANVSWPVIEKDIHEVPTSEILEIAGLDVGEADLLVGGPPCQPFSKSGYWATGDSRRLDDARATTLEAFLRVLRDAQPRAFLLENVPGLAYKRKSEGLDLLEATVESINKEVGTSYSICVQLLNAAEHGVPQLRERVFIIGQREGLEFNFPRPTHWLPKHVTHQTSIEAIEREPYFTAWDAIGDLQDDDDPELAMTGNWAELLPSIPEGMNYLHHTDRGDGFPLFGWRRRYWSFLLKLSKRLPAWTITAQPGSAIGPFHWKSRRFSMRELCRLQTFPESYEVKGSRGAILRQVGNAVPSALAELLGIEIRHQLLGDNYARRRKRKLLPTRRTPIPAPEQVAPLHPKYHPLVGEYEAHPGTGKGYGATARQETVTNQTQL